MHAGCFLEISPNRGTRYSRDCRNDSQPSMPWVGFRCPTRASAPQFCVVRSITSHRSPPAPTCAQNIFDIETAPIKERDFEEAQVRPGGFKEVFENTSAHKRRHTQVAQSVVIDRNLFTKTVIERVREVEKQRHLEEKAAKVIITTKLGPHLALALASAHTQPWFSRCFRLSVRRKAARTEGTEKMVTATSITVAAIVTPLLTRPAPAEMAVATATVGRGRKEGMRTANGRETPAPSRPGTRTATRATRKGERAVQPTAP